MKANLSYAWFTGQSESRPVEISNCDYALALLWGLTVKLPKVQVGQRGVRLMRAAQTLPFAPYCHYDG